MCGIAGVYGWTDERILGDMLSCITHRGPDEEGTFVGDSIMMGISRLSIIDIEGGSQPIWNEDETVSVVFNGEIYNYRELRDDLESKGHNFTTESDTEVLVHLWEEYGTEMPTKLNGMFAFSIWDEEEDSLFLARDRLGIKPLYYSNGDSFVWGSELPAVLASGVEKKLDEKAVYNYFSLQYSPWPRTLFRGIKKLQPGTSLLVTKESGSTKINKKQYWCLDPSRQIEGGADDIARRLRGHLERSIDRRLVADVPVGAFLSGGLDSSTVVGLMSEMKEDVETFSVAFESESDESDEARYVADYFGTDHHEVTVDLDSVDVFGDVVKHYGEPLPDPAVLPTMVLSEYTRDNVKVALTGSGADEIFGGYWMHRTVPRHRKKAERVPKYLFRAASHAATALPFGREYLEYLGSLESDEKAVAEAAQRFRPLPTKEYMETELDARESGIYDMVRDSFSYASEDTLSRISSFYLTHWLPDDILYKVDHATMYASLEARVPFLDHNLVEFTYSIPSEYIARKGEYKPILKRAVSDILPERTLQRKKQGFGIQQGNWLKSDHDAISKWLAEEKLEQVKYLDSERVLSMWSSHRREDGEYGDTLWKILNYVAWYHEYAKG